MSTLLPAADTSGQYHLTFNPEEGTTVLAPPGEGPGNWIGACDVIFDRNKALFYLYARTRRPANPGDPEQRGASISIYESRDGLSFKRIWSAHRSQFNTVSIEKGSLSIMPDGRCRLYLSYECPVGRGWQIDLLEADSFADLEPATRRTILSPSDVGSHQVKDPIAVDLDGSILLYANYGVADGGEAAGIAISEDGETFKWQGRVLPESSSESWDCWSSRATGIIRRDSTWYMFYDGASVRNQCFEEQCGIAVGTSPYSFTRLTADMPLVPGAPRGNMTYNQGRTFPSIGGCRYVTPVETPDGLFCYYEWTRSDGSHEVRVSRLNL